MKKIYLALVSFFILSSLFFYKKFYYLNTDMIENHIQKLSSKPNSEKEIFSYLSSISKEVKSSKRIEVKAVYQYYNALYNFKKILSMNQYQMSPTIKMYIYNNIKGSLANAQSKLHPVILTNKIAQKQYAKISSLIIEMQDYFNKNLKQISEIEMREMNKLKDINRERFRALQLIKLNGEKNKNRQTNETLKPRMDKFSLKIVDDVTKSIR